MSLLIALLEGILQKLFVTYKTVQKNQHMDIFQNILYIIILIEFFLCIKRSLYGLCGLISIRILIPEIVRVSSAISLSVNTICVLLLLLSIVKEKNINIFKYATSRTILIFMFFLLLFLPISDYADLKYQTFSVVKLFLTDFLPAILAINIIKDKNDVEIIVRVLSISIIISCLWALTTMFLGANPYNDLIIALYKENIIENNSDVAWSFSSSGTFSHRNGFGFFIPIALSFYIIVLSYKKSTLNYLVVLFLLVGALCCQKRTCFIAILSYLLFVFMFMKMEKKIYYLKYIFLLVMMFILVVNMMPKDSKLGNVVTTSIFFWNDKIAESNDISGSSMEMRIEQVTYPFVMIKNNLLFGKGSGYIDYYQNKLGNLVHPVMKGFETILSKIEVENGIMGFFLWGYFIFKMIWTTRLHDKKREIFLYGFWVSQLMIWFASGFSSFALLGVLAVIIPKLNYMIKDKE